MSKKRSDKLLDSTEGLLFRLVERSKPKANFGQGVTVPPGETPLDVKEMIAIAQAATKFLTVKYKIKPDEGDDDDSFLIRAQRSLAGSAVDGTPAQRRRGRTRPKNGGKTDGDGTASNSGSDEVGTGGHGASNGSAPAAASTDAAASKADGYEDRA